MEGPWKGINVTPRGLQEAESDPSWKHSGLSWAGLGLSYLLCRTERKISHYELVLGISYQISLKMSIAINQVLDSRSKIPAQLWPHIQGLSQSRATDPSSHLDFGP